MSAWMTFCRSTLSGLYDYPHLFWSISSNASASLMALEGNSVEVVELNVGGVTYATTFTTLQQAEPESPLATITSGTGSDARTNVFGRDNKNRIFIDRDGVLFRYVLDYLRNKKLSLPENFSERHRLRVEADFYRLTAMSQALASSQMSPSSNGKSPNDSISHVTAATNALDLHSSMTSGRPPPPRSSSGYIVIGYRGTFGELTRQCCCSTCTMCFRA